MYYNEGDVDNNLHLIYFCFLGGIMRESVYQRGLIKRLAKMFPGCFITINDPSQNQGIPDILILFRDRWAMLETKRAPNSSQRPNQPYYVDLFNEMSFAAFINPQNEEMVLNDLQHAFGVGW